MSDEIRKEIREGFAGVNQRIDACNAKIDDVQKQVSELAVDTQKEFGVIKEELGELRGEAKGIAKAWTDMRNNVVAIIAVAAFLMSGFGISWKGCMPTPEPAAQSAVEVSAQDNNK